MRFVSRKESAERGCYYCTHSRSVPQSFQANVKDCIIFCDYYDCPYSELDGYKKYDDYLRENGLYCNMKHILVIDEEVEEWK